MRDVQYDPDTHFISYKVMGKDETYSYLLRYFQDGQTDENFRHYYLRPVIASENTNTDLFRTPVYTRKLQIMNKNDALALLNDSRHETYRVKKDSLSNIISAFDVEEKITTSRVGEALDFLSKPLQVLLDVKLTEIISEVAGKTAEKKAEGRCALL